MRVQTIAIQALVCAPITLANPLKRRQNGSGMIYGFAGIEATDGLQWQPCFDKFTCTKIKVPLDYANETAGTTHVSFIKWSSNSTSANSTKDILLNPGGPGGSGIQDLTTGLPFYLSALGTDYNLVSFDPRGVNNSGPDLSCFKNTQLGTSKLYSRDFQKPLDSSDIRDYHRAFQKAAALGDFCTKAHSAANDTAKYANTVATVTDMLRFTELAAKARGQAPEKSELWYYGISYGTVIGTTFAALFPDRVGRIIVDGVVDGEDYYQAKWANNLLDADKAVEYFFQACYDAGKDKCKFWESSPAAIEKRFHAAMDNLALDPIPVSDEDTPAIATIDDFKSLLLNVPYSPIAYFPILVEALLELEKRDATIIASFTGIGTLPEGSCIPKNPNAPPVVDLEPRIFISCTDGNNRFNLSTFDSFKTYADGLVNQSRYLGEAWAIGTGVLCRKLDIRPPKSQVFEGYPSANKTSNPLLFISTKIDPVTPLVHAEKMAARFGGAALLVQDSVGHSSTSSPSKCTSGYVRNFLKDASLPKAGTHCPPDRVPFERSGNSTSQSTLRKRDLPGLF